MKYSIKPGLYSIGSPNDTSPVLVTANYRLSCHHLRLAMEKSNVWVLVLDTKGINVWCAAGKGTFGTAELINRITATNLSGVVKHRTLILPQLGAPGVAAHEVKKATGFNVIYGPIYARDIPAFIAVGNRASAAMRSVGFSMKDRLVLTPMEFLHAFKKFAWVVLGCFAVMGIQPYGILFRPAVFHSLPIVAAGIAAVIAGSIVTPLLLPFIPFRGFAAKGALVGAAALCPTLFSMDYFYRGSFALAASAVLFFVAVSSYLALNFTGCTPFTNISGVKKEMRFAVPGYLFACGLSAVFLIVYKLNEWGVL
jgi:acetyl-CoA decarbonylase/synthase complex subunit gamma